MFTCSPLLAEGYWLKQSSISPYSGSMYHGSPLLLAILGPLTVIRFEGQPEHIACSLLFVIADLITAILIRATGQKLHLSYKRSLKSLNVTKLLETSGMCFFHCAVTAEEKTEVEKISGHGSHESEILSAGDIAAFIYLWNPLTIVTCVGLSTSPVENLMIVLSLYGACSCLAPLAAFGWVLASHLSLYPAILIIPVIFLLGYGPDTPPKKLFRQQKSESNANDLVIQNRFSWRPVVHFILWASFWTVYVLVLCSIYLKQYGGLSEMFKRTHGFILTLEDLSPNIGVLWYFFAEVFDFFRDFFLIVFHVNILFMLLPLAIRLYHRPCFLAFIYIAISSMLKSYPSVGDSALYLALLGWVLEMQTSIMQPRWLMLACRSLHMRPASVFIKLYLTRTLGSVTDYFGCRECKCYASARQNAKETIDHMKPEICYEIIFHYTQLRFVEFVKQPTILKVFLGDSHSLNPTLAKI
ncbi:hypothetical protein C5167_004722 [Papaver somniferum]|uniref:GPI transamidase subunit PIG-U n=1 Tax=Papaver somniferum TaxID=3469 RepID=A0A4Y7JC90_PAPSO|nr:hypothetical protein C5167_004722 [Papaver somniferum]